ncbi:uncharacterized protein LOC127107601 [Lathyrus oleraceus]|uniref:uncharacterized protein LOC127100507 n=1 Tax=Pisum sativum TaxID=3888 RepID=UPI0021CFC2C8|nr:uncharacterized protein LOC127100507 [Pisum sativum]XP_050900851.1 uncharacterized protein LOC127107601 [Pisum sativum]
MQWKLTRGKWRPRLLDFVSSIEDAVVKRASEKAFESLPDVEKAISELSALKGVGPATASAVLAAFAPNLTPFMSDEVVIRFCFITSYIFSSIPYIIIIMITVHLISTFFSVSVF